MAKTDDDILRVMVDANVLVAGTGWPRFPYEVLQHAVKRDYQLVLCPLLIKEAEKYVERIIPHRLPNFRAILEDSQYEVISDPSPEEIESHQNILRDPKDVYVAVAAINVQVDLLITQDKDFTDRDESTTKLHEKLNVMLPGTFLREHMSWTSEALEAIRNRNWEDIE